MTKINHRLFTIPRRSPAAYDAAPQRELAYLDATTQMQLEGVRYGKHTTLSQFVYTQDKPRRGGSR